MKLQPMFMFILRGARRKEEEAPRGHARSASAVTEPQNFSLADLSPQPGHQHDPWPEKGTKRHHIAIAHVRFGLIFFSGRNEAITSDTFFEQNHPFEQCFSADFWTDKIWLLKSLLTLVIEHVLNNCVRPCITRVYRRYSNIFWGA